MLGEPALEGAHSDRVDITMTTFLSNEDMRSGSATIFIHNIKEQKGIRAHEANPSLVLDSYQHRDFLDTFLFADYERKYSLSPVLADDPDKLATQDVLIFFTRKPVQEGHILYKYDSFEPHRHFDWRRTLHITVGIEVFSSKFSMPAYPKLMRSERGGFC